MVKTYNKSILRMFKSNIVRLLTITFIIAIGISIVTGICALPDKMVEAAKTVTDPAQAMLIEVLADKTRLIGYIFPVFFIAIATLTALTTITRLIEEERPSIACLKTLGYSNFSIVIKYILFAVVCAVLGCILGLIIGNFAILPVLFKSVMSRFNLANSGGTIYVTQGIIWSVAMGIAVIITAIVIGWLKCKERPATLLRAKAPKAGKKIVLEYIPFIWKRLKFKYKSSVRNIFRYKGRLFMTLLSVIGSTIILFLGLGLYGSLSGMQNDTAKFSTSFFDSIIPISVILVIFGIALAILVLFNLTNINIEERKREIATLKVLGYSQTEVSGFIYREIMLISAFAIIIGIPLGYWLLGFVFDYIDFGSLSYVKWYIWLITAVLAFLSVLITDFLLYWKIKKVDMSSSLKTVD